MSLNDKITDVSVTLQAKKLTSAKGDGVFDFMAHINDIRPICLIRMHYNNACMDRKNTEEMLGLKETLDGMAKVNGVRWYGQVDM